MTKKVDKTQGLTCPNCRGVVPIPEGARIVECPYCDMRSLVQGERGVRRWQVSRRVDREDALQAMSNFLTGLNKAVGLKREAKINDVFLIYLPYWRVTSFVAGWMFGRVKSGKDSTRPVEVEVLEEMHWNDAAADVSEFGVHRVSISKADLELYDDEQLHREGMVFEPSESRTEAMDEAERHFKLRGVRKENFKSRYFDKFHFLRTQFSLVYYPLWVARYQYRKRTYQVVVDGVKGKVLYGKAPGNIFFRAAALVLGMSIGNFICVNGTLAGGLLVAGSGEDESFWAIVVPFAIGVGMMIAGYRAFRHGEEVEEIQAENKKAELYGGGKSKKRSNEFLETGMSILEELGEWNK